MRRVHGRRHPFAACLVLSAVLVGGCTSLGGPGSSGSVDEIRPDAPAEYDVLVAQDHEYAGRSAEALAAYRRASEKDPDAAFLQRKLAEALVREQLFDEAQVHAQRAFELEPEDVPTRVFLGQLYGRRRNYDGAIHVLTGDDGEPISQIAGVLLFQVYSDAERFDEALTVAEWLRDQEPHSVQAYVALANVYQRLERPLDAEEVLRTALELEPDNLRLSAALARSYRERGDHAAELEVYRSILAERPQHQATLIALAEAQMSLDDLEGAIATFEQIEEHHPEDLRSAVRLGFLKFDAGDWEGARERFVRFLAAHPDEYGVVFFLGRAERRLRDDDAAIAAYLSIPRDHKRYVDSRTELASIYERRRQFDLALAEVELANDALVDVPSQPEVAETKRALELYSTTLRAKAGDFDGAVAYLEGLLAESPDDDNLLYNLGVVYGEAKQTDESIRYMQLALETNPDNASALNYVAYTWAEKGVRLDEAEEMIVRALELRPDDGYITDSLGWVYYMRARPLVENGRDDQARPYIDRALRELRRADELTGGDPVVSEHLGDIYLLKGDKARALRRFEEAVELEPREGEQPQLFDKLERLRDELPRAVIPVRWARAALLLGFALGCQTVPVVPLAADDPRPVTWLAAWREASAERQSLRGVAKIAVNGDDLKLRSTQRIVVERPSRLRVEVTGLLDQVVAVLVTDGDRYELIRAEDRGYETGSVGPGLLWQQTRIDLTPEEAIGLLLGAPVLDPTLVPVRALDLGRGAMAIELADDRDVVRERVEVDAAGRLGRLEVRDAAGMLEWSADYTGYGDSAPPLATRIELFLAVRGVEAEIALRDAELNPTLPSGVFRLRGP